MLKRFLYRLIIFILFVSVLFILINPLVVSINSKRSREADLNIWVISPNESIWKEIGPFKSGLSLSLNGINGELIDKQGNCLLTIGSDASIRNSDGVFCIQNESINKHNFRGQFDITGQNLFVDQLVEYPYLISTSTDNQILRFYINDSISGKLYGYAKTQGGVIQEPQYISATDFFDGKAVVTAQTDTGEKNYIIDLYGNSILASIQNAYYDQDYWTIRDIHDGYLLMLHPKLGASTQDEYKFLGIDNSIIPDKGRGFDEARDFCNGYAAVKKMGKWGFVSSTKGKITEYVYDQVFDFHDGYAAVKIDGLWGYINMLGDTAIPMQYTDVTNFIDGFACATDENGDIFVIDKDGELVSQKVDGFKTAGECHGNYFTVKTKNDEWQLLNLEGEKVIPSSERFVQWSEGIWLVGKSNDDCGVYLPDCGKYYPGDSTAYQYANRVVVTYNKKDSMYDIATGQQICSYDEIAPFSEGVACVQQGNQCGYIDINGALIIPMQHFVGRNFSNGVAVVTYGSGRYRRDAVLANPLIYDSWSNDENVRAKQLGICAQGTEAIDYDELWNAIDTLVALKKETSEKMSIDLPMIDLKSFRSELEHSGLPTEGAVEKQYVATLLAELSKKYGGFVDGYCVFYRDSGEIAESCKSSVGYVSSLGIFDAGTDIFGPCQKITGNELSVYLLRFYENTL